MNHIRATWQHDTATVECMDCKKKFSLFVRRHHCRGCGGVYCAKCCDQKVKGVKGYDKKDSQRVCNRCYALIVAAAKSSGVGGGAAAVGVSKIGSQKGPRARQRKILIIGAKGVGKTSLIYRYTHDASLPSGDAAAGGENFTDGNDSQNTFVPLTPSVAGAGSEGRGRSKSIASNAKTVTAARGAMPSAFAGGTTRDARRSADNNSKNNNNGGDASDVDDLRTPQGIEAFLRSIEKTVLDKGQEYCLTFAEATYEPRSCNSGGGRDGGGGGGGGGGEDGGGGDGNDAAFENNSSMPGMGPNSSADPFSLVGDMSDPFGQGTTFFGTSGGGGGGEGGRDMYYDLAGSNQITTQSTAADPSSSSAQPSAVAQTVVGGGGGGQQQKATGFDPKWAIGVHAIIIMYAVDDQHSLSILQQLREDMIRCGLLSPPYLDNTNMPATSAASVAGGGGAVAAGHGGGGAAGASGGGAAAAAALSSAGDHNLSNANGITNMNASYYNGGGGDGGGGQGHPLSGAAGLPLNGVGGGSCGGTASALPTLSGVNLTSLSFFPNALFCGASNDVVTVLVGNKADCPMAHREVEPSDAAFLARAWGVSHYELSAKDPYFAQLEGVHKRMGVGVGGGGGAGSTHSPMEEQHHHAHHHHHHSHLHHHHASVLGGGVGVGVGGEPRESALLGAGLGMGGGGLGPTPSNITTNGFGGGGGVGSSSSSLDPMLMSSQQHPLSSGNTYPLQPQQQQGPIGGGPSPFSSPPLPSPPSQQQQQRQAQQPPSYSSSSQQQVVYVQGINGTLQPMVMLPSGALVPANANNLNTINDSNANDGDPLNVHGRSQQSMYHDNSTTPNYFPSPTAVGGAFPQQQPMPMMLGGGVGYGVGQPQPAFLSSPYPLLFAASPTGLKIHEHQPAPNLLLSTSSNNYPNVTPTTVAANGAGDIMGGVGGQQALQQQQQQQHGGSTLAADAFTLSPQLLQHLQQAASVLGVNANFPPIIADRSGGGGALLLAGGGGGGPFPTSNMGGGAPLTSPADVGSRDGGSGAANINNSSHSKNSAATTTPANGGASTATGVQPTPSPSTGGIAGSSASATAGSGGDGSGGSTQLCLSGLFFEPRMASLESCANNPTVDTVFKYLMTEIGRKDGV